MRQQGRDESHTVSSKHQNVRNGIITFIVRHLEFCPLEVKWQCICHNAIGNWLEEQDLGWGASQPLPMVKVVWDTCFHNFLDPWYLSLQVLVGWRLYLLNKNSANSHYQGSLNHPGLSLRFSYLSGEWPQMWDLKKQIPADLHFGQGF